jgi:hypothetical protein
MLWIILNPKYSFLREVKALNISIGSIRVNTISTIGSLNIGKTILARNRASVQNVLSDRLAELSTDTTLETVDTADAALYPAFDGDSPNDDEAMMKPEVRNLDPIQ